MCVTRRDSNNVALLFEKGYCIAQWAKSLKKKNIAKKYYSYYICVCNIFILSFFSQLCTTEMGNFESDERGAGFWFE